MSALSSADDLDRIVARRPTPADASRTRASVNLMPTPTSLWSRARLTLHRRALYGRDPATLPSRRLIGFRPQSGGTERGVTSRTRPPTRGSCLLRPTRDTHRRSALILPA
jgi:hypothetical protein